MSTLKADPKKRIQVMAAHDLFRRVDGCPFAINNLVNIYRNPFTEKNKLVHLYEQQLSLLQPTKDADS